MDVLATGTNIQKLPGEIIDWWLPVTHRALVQIQAFSSSCSAALLTWPSPVPINQESQLSSLLDFNYRLINSWGKN